MNLQRLMPFVYLLIVCISACTSPNNTREVEASTASSELHKTKVQNLLTGKVNKLKHDVLSAAEIANFEHGDIILRKGYGFASDFISVFLEEKYVVTHCGIVVIDSLDPSKINILHTVTSGDHDGMILEPLEVFIKDSQLNSLALVRTKFSKAEIEAAVNIALSFLEKKILFDMDFNDHDDSKYYCAEMIRNAFTPIVKADILPKRAFKMNKEVTHMSNFFDTTYFSVIFNHNIAQY